MYRQAQAKEDPVQTPPIDGCLAEVDLITEPW